MEQTIKLGNNKTGLAASPSDSAELINITKITPADIVGSPISLMQQRQNFISESDRIGSVPYPKTLKGVVSTAVKKLTGNPIEIFIDKLGERLAFERSGIRFYEALLAKITLSSEFDKDAVAKLEVIRADEYHHFNMLVQILTSMGADPTAQTPCADIAGVSGLGLVQVITDPRTTLSQSLNAILTIELVDNASWEMLIKLAHKFGQEDFTEQLNRALNEEINHLTFIKQLFEKTLMMGL